MRIGFVMEIAVEWRIGAECIRENKILMINRKVNKSCYFGI